AAGELRVTPDGAWVSQESLLLYMAGRLSATVSHATASPPGGVLESTLLSGLLLLTLLAVLVQLFSIQDDAPIFSGPLLAGVVAGVLAICVWLARRQGGFSSVNGFGTTLLGSRRTPDGFVGTAWVVAAMVPLVPYRSYVLLEAHEERSPWIGQPTTRSYMLRALDDVCWPQAGPVLAASWGGLMFGGWLLATWGG
ncbi:MAG TPA: hypothetical protein PKA64_07365, partial [Myxococcota bacterium]|nr:hypothetical protein [Myxococcota bacterium]